MIDVWLKKHKYFSLTVGSSNCLRLKLQEYWKVSKEAKSDGEEMIPEKKNGEMTDVFPMRNMPQ